MAIFGQTHKPSTVMVGVGKSSNHHMSVVSSMEEESEMH